MSTTIMHGSSGLSPESGLMARTWDLDGEYRRRVVAAAVPFDAHPDYAETNGQAIGYMQDLIMRCVANPALRPSSIEDNARKLLYVINEWRAGYCPGIQGIALAVVEIEDPIVFARIFATGNGKASTSGDNKFSGYTYPIEEVLEIKGLPHVSYVADTVTQNNVRISSNVYALRVSAGFEEESRIDEELDASQMILAPKSEPGAYIYIAQG